MYLRLFLLAALLGASPLAAQDTERQIRRELRQVAKAQDADGGKVADLSRRRAVLEAERGNVRLADWYWWVSGIFEAWPSDAEMIEQHGELAASALFAVRRPAPEVRRSQLSSSELERIGRESVTNRPPDPPTLMVRACKGEESVVGFEATIGSDGYYRSPRVDLKHLNTVPPICAFGVLERHRDYRHPLPAGRAVVIRENLKTRDQLRPH